MGVQMRADKTSIPENSFTRSEHHMLVRGNPLRGEDPNDAALILPVKLCLIFYLCIRFAIFGKHVGPESDFI